MDNFDNLSDFSDYYEEQYYNININYSNNKGIIDNKYDDINDNNDYNLQKKIENIQILYNKWHDYSMKFIQEKKSSDKFLFIKHKSYSISNLQGGSINKNGSLTPRSLSYNKNGINQWNNANTTFGIELLDECEEVIYPKELNSLTPRNDKSKNFKIDLNNCFTCFKVQYDIEYYNNYGKRLFDYYIKKNIKDKKKLKELFYKRSIDKLEINKFLVEF